MFKQPSLIVCILFRPSSEITTPRSTRSNTCRTSPYFPNRWWLNSQRTDWVRKTWNDFFFLFSFFFFHFSFFIFLSQLFASFSFRVCRYLLTHFLLFLWEEAWRGLIMWITKKFPSLLCTPLTLWPFVQKLERKTLDRNTSYLMHLSRHFYDKNWNVQNVQSETNIFFSNDWK